MNEPPPNAHIAAYHAFRHAVWAGRAHKARGTDFEYPYRTLADYHERCRLRIEREMQQNKEEK